MIKAYQQWQFERGAPVTPDEILKGVVSRGLVPGAAAVLSVGGKQTHAYCGSASLDPGVPLTAESRFQVSCLMKFFVSLIALAMAKEKQLDIEAPLGRYLDDFHAAAPRRSDAIKVRHLMSHSSGYIGLDINSARAKWGYTWPALLDFIRDTPQLFEPGTIFSYEHTEHVILGEIIARITGRSASDAVRRQIFEPLGIQPRQTQRFPHADEVTGYRTGTSGTFSKITMPSPGRFWESSIPAMTLRLSDIVKVGEAILARSIPIFGKELIAQLTTPAVFLPRMPTNDWSELTPTSFGLACAQYPNGIVGLNGSYAGHTCALRLIPAQDAVIGVAINAWAPDVRDAIARNMSDPITGRSHAGENTPNREDLETLLGPFSTKDVMGRYLGAFHGEISVEAIEGLPIARFDGAEGRQVLFQIKRVGDYKYRLLSQFPISAAFFPDPSDNEPCIAVGVHCYKKVLS